MTKLSIFVLVCLSVTALSSARPARGYNQYTFYHFLHDLIRQNDNELNNLKLEEQNQENESNESSENSSEEKSESDYSVDLSSLRAGSIASDSSIPSEIITDRPEVQEAATTVPLMTTLANVDVTTQGVPAVSTAIERGDAGNAPVPVPGVNSPRINVMTTKLPKRTVKKVATTEKQTPEAKLKPAAPTCRTSCPLSTGSTVCASDGVTYVSRCVFEAVMCGSGTPEIVILHEEECKETTDTSNLKPATEDFMP